MHLQIIENRREKIEAQTRFNRLLESIWRENEIRTIVWRPDKRDLNIAHNRHCWFVSVKPASTEANGRYWNSFGIYSPAGSLVITVEINIPIARNDLRVSGFFARDQATGVTYLMHDGGVGGGHKGVGQGAFLSWSSMKLVPVDDSNGRTRLGIIVTPLIAKDVGAMVTRFVLRVAQFKQDVRDGKVPSGTISGGQAPGYGDYFREHSGVKKGSRRREIEYISRHGDIVDKLASYHPRKKGERLIKNALIDLGVERAGRLVFLYEVKTNTDRQAMYTAIGQLLVHGGMDNSLERCVVIPSHEGIAPDIDKILRILQIKVLRYSLVGDNVVLHED